MTIGIFHTKYLQHGGEDQVVEAEALLLEQSGSVTVKTLILTNPSSALRQMLALVFLPFNVFTFFKVLRWLRREKIAVLHVHNWMFAGSPAVFTAARLAGVPVVHTLHNYRLLCPSASLYRDGRIYLDSLKKSFPTGAIRNGVYRKSKVLTFWLSFSVWLHTKLGTWAAISRYVVLSPHMLELIRESHMRQISDRVTVKPNFSSNPGIASAERQEHFLFVGRLAEEKGIKVLLEAFTNTTYQLKIIGSGPLQADVEAAAAANPNISFLGFRKNRDLLDEVAACTALRFPSVWYEPFGLTIIEAFSTGTPVIASNLGAPASLVEHEKNGLHFTGGDAHALKKCLARWTSMTPEERDAYSRRARQDYYSRFTPQENSRQLLSIYAAVALAPAAAFAGSEN
jgi:glycosyltransferase involved in cell wall biosynthesis